MSLDCSYADRLHGMLRIMKQVWRRFPVVAFAFICIAGVCVAQTAEDALKKGFEHPPSLRDRGCGGTG